MYRILEPLPEKRVPLDQMFDDPWFKLGSEPSTDPSRMSTSDAPRGSVFLPGPSHHAYTTHDGVTIMDADTQQIAYSRQVFPMHGPGGIALPSVHQQIPAHNQQRISNGSGGGANNGTADDNSPEPPLTHTWSKAGRINDPDN